MATGAVAALEALVGLLLLLLLILVLVLLLVLVLRLCRCRRRVSELSSRGFVGLDRAGAAVGGFIVKWFYRIVKEEWRQRSDHVREKNMGWVN